MNRQFLQNYQKKILSLIKLLGEKDSLDLPGIEFKEHCSLNIDKKDTIIPFHKIK